MGGLAPGTGVLAGSRLERAGAAATGLTAGRFASGTIGVRGPDFLGMCLSGGHSEGTTDSQGAGWSVRISVSQIQLDRSEIVWA
jgi:hypothetical protein